MDEKGQTTNLQSVKAFHVTLINLTIKKDAVNVQQRKTSHLGAKYSDIRKNYPSISEN